MDRLSANLAAMNGDEHLQGLGKVVANLQSLELVLRIFLCDSRGEKFQFPKVGDKSLPLSPLTDFRSLGELVAAYNGSLSTAESRFQVDASVVDMRDGLAHGRLAASNEEFPLTLYRFGRPDKSSGAVPVLRITTLDEVWFDSSRRLTFDQIHKVRECSLARGYNSMK